MLQNEVPAPDQTPNAPAMSRVGDLAAMLRIMGPLNVSLPDPIVGQRRLLADLCRFIGVQVGAVPPESLGFAPDAGLPVDANSDNPNSNRTTVTAIPTELSRRMEQTLKHLLNGDSEKQVARKLELSPHTVHGYVKALYRKSGVSSRGELLAKHLGQARKTE